jgi:hypothetical protein
MERDRVINRRKKRMEKRERGERRRKIKGDSVVEKRECVKGWLR